MKQLKVLQDDEFIDNKSYHYLKPIDLPAPRFLVIHKPVVPVRLIVSYSGFPLYNLNEYKAHNVKAYVKDENNNAKNSTTFSNYIRNFLFEDDKIMVSLDVTSLYTNSTIIDTLKLTKNYVDNDGQITRKNEILPCFAKIAVVL